MTSASGAASLAASIRWIRMKRIAFALACLLALAAPAAAQEWRDALAGGEKALAAEKIDDAIRLFRQALAGGAEGRERVRAWHGLAGAAIRAQDFASAETAIEQARMYITEKFGADDIAMAGNRQLHGVVRLRAHNDREGARDAFATAARIRNAKVDAWDESEGPMGAVGHKPSGLKLPARAASLVQFRRDINNDDGTDVSLGYRASRAGAISVTVYIYRPLGEFRAIFDEEIKVIRAFNPQAVLHREEAQALETKAGKIEGRLARFEYAAQGGVLGTRLYLFPLKRDYVKLRVTFRADDEAFADTQVAALLAAIGWPAQ
jgi:tetratricopeptide (TPR) repeat protein